jgi:hypothetical protein
MIRHFVLFTPPDSIPADELDDLLRAAAALPRSISDIRNFHLGQTFDAVMQPRWAYCLSMEFEDEAALARYVEHDAHRAFRDAFRVAIDDRVTHTARPASV